MLNGVKIMVGLGGASQVAEVRVNGRLHEAASAALEAMDWPRTAKMNVRHLFLLLVHPEDMHFGGDEDEASETSG